MALALAMALYLRIHASEAATFSIAAEGRDREQISRIEGNLILETYRSLAPSAPPLHMTIRNEIPLGDGLRFFGNRAAGRCFAGKPLRMYRIVTRASSR